MTSAARAIAWQFQRRHRWGLLGLAGYLSILLVLKLYTLGSGRTVDLHSSERFALVVAVPLATTFLYVLTVFTFGLSGDVAARQSIYPARLFTLPVSTAALAGWPMVFGTAVIALLWLVARPLIPWPDRAQVPVVWPAAMAAAALAWVQALTWMPYGLPGMRIVVAVLTLSSMDAVIMLALHFRPTELAMLAGLLPLLPLAYLVARRAVSRARHGDVPDWRGAFARLGRLADRLPRRRYAFRSPGHALERFEWRRHGRSLPLMVLLVLPFQMALLVAAGSERRTLVLGTLVSVLLTPPFLAAFAAATVRTSSPDGRDAYALGTFLASKPVTSAALIASKLKTTLRSTLVAWLLVLVAVPLALTLANAWPIVMERADHLVEVFGQPRAAVFALLVLAALMASTWKQLVQSLFIGLSGREVWVKASVAVTFAALFAVGPLARFVHDNQEARVKSWEALPWILALLAGLKTAAAVWLAVSLHRSRLLDERTLLAGAAVWLAAVLALYGLLAWFLGTPLLPRHVLGLVAILEVPLVRVAAAAPALDWNRHR